MDPLDIQNSHDYWAFISFSHHDRKVARWLKAELAKRKVPRPFRRLTMPESLTFENIFLDESSAGANGILSAEFERALQRSKSLIVLCSTYAVASNFVSDEIKYFKAKFPERNIVCLVVSGVPNAEDLRLECFPDPLRHELLEDGSLGRVLAASERPLAAVLGDESAGERKRAVEQIIAGLLGISQESLAEFASHRELINRMIFFGSFLAILAISFFLWWAYFATTTLYFKNYVRRFGDWEGVDAVKSSDAAQMHSVYRFSSKGALRKVDSIELVNGSGECSSPGIASILGNYFTSECSIAFGCKVQLERKSDGSVDAEDVHDQFGKPLERILYSIPGRAVFTDAYFACSRTASGINEIQISRFLDGEKRGLDKRLMFYNGEANEPRINSSRAYGVQFDYDNRFRVSSVTNLDAQGLPLLSNENCASLSSTWDTSGNRLTRTCLTEKELPTVDMDGIAGWISKFDDHGNETLRSYRDVSGLPTSNRLGVAQLERNYDLSGNVILEKHVGEDGNPTVAKGLPLEDDSFFSDGTRWATAEIKFDKNSNEVERDFFGIDHQLIFNENGFAVRLTASSVEKREISVRFLDNARKPTIRVGWNGDSCYQDRIVYAENGAILENWCLDASGNATARQAGGAAVWKEEYDSKGRDAATLYSDKSNAPTLTGDGVAGYRRLFDPMTGAEIKKTFIDAYNKPAFNSSSNFAISESIYNDQGDIHIQKYFDPKGNPYGPCVAYEAEWGRHGKLPHQSFYQGGLSMKCVDPSGAPAIDAKDGISSVKVLQDAYGEALEGNYFDEKSQPIKDKVWGAERIKFAYDRFGHRTDAWLFTHNDEPLIGLSGFHHLHRTFNSLGLLQSSRYFDPSGAAIEVDGMIGMDFDYDKRGLILRAKYIARGEGRALVLGCSGMVFKTDLYGRETMRTCIDARDLPTMSTDNWASEETIFDSNGFKVETKELDLEGKIVLNKYGLARAVISNDAFGNPLRREYFDGSGKRTMALSYGKRVSIITHRYDDYQRIVEDSFFGTDGADAENIDGAHKVTYEYDSKGNLLRTVGTRMNGKTVQKKSS